MIETGSADAVAAIHVIEHFYDWEALPLILEWRRILKPGGKMILELPCLDKIFRYVADCLKDGEKAMYAFMTLHALYGDPKHRDPLMMHKNGFFHDRMKALLTEAGMREIQSCKPRYHFPGRDQRWEAIK